MIFHWLYWIGKVWAEEGGAEHAAAGHGETVTVPWDSIFVQTFNITFLMAVLFFILRKTVKAHFEHRARDYNQLVERAEKARAEAEKGRQEVKERLAKLDASADQVLQRARSEAEELRGRMVQEAKTLAQRMQVESERTVKVETEKAKAELRADLLESAIVAARESLKKNMSSSEQQKLQREFAEKIQVVGG